MFPAPLRPAAVLAAALVLLVGCSSPAPASDPDGEPAPAASATPAPDSPDVPDAPEPLDNPDGPVLVTSRTGAGLAAFGEPGFYQAVANPEGGYNILFSDYAARQTVYLCSRADCPHRDDSCTAWLDCVGLSLFLSKDQESLFALATDGQRETLWQMEPDGGGRRILFQTASGENLTDAVACDGEALYLTVRVLGQQMADTRKELRRLALDTGDCRTLLTMEDSHWLFGAWPGSLVLLCHDAARNTDTWRACDPDTGALTDLYSYPNDYGARAPTALPDGQLLYLFVPDGEDTCRLVRRDLVTGQETVLGDGLPYYGGGSLSAGSVCGGYLYLTIQDVAGQSPEIRQYLLRLEDGAALPLTLTFQQGGISSGCEPVAAVGSFFVVNTGMQSLEVQVTGQDGVPYTATVDVPAYAMIRQEDFLAGNPAWLTFSPPAGG